MNRIFYCTVLLIWAGVALAESTASPDSPGDKPVMLSVVSPPDGEANPVTPAPAASRFHHSLAVTQFQVLDRTQIADLPGIEVELARELQRRLQAVGGVQVVDASTYLAPLSGANRVARERSLGVWPPARAAGQMAIEFADSLGTQFVLTGLIRDMGISKPLLRPRLRHIDLELTVHDGLTGVEVSRLRVRDSVELGTWLDPRLGGPVFSEKFYASFYGRRLDQLLDDLTARLAGTLRGQPFTARVIRADGSRIYFDAGDAARLRVGDELQALQVLPAALLDVPGQRLLGFEEHPAATLVVTQVQSRFAVGRLANDSVRLARGDILRFTP